MPEDQGLCKKDFQDFMKRLRKHIAPKKIRYFHCGEYGERLQRPHYHALIFGHEFADKTIWKESANSKIYISQELATLWPFGFSTIANVTFETAAYVSRYVLKKMNGEKAETHYRTTDSETGEQFDVQSEYITMSRRPGIAHKWFEKYKTDVFPSDEVVIKGKQMKPPKYYSGLFQHEDPETMEKIKKARRQKALKYKSDMTHDRLEVRHEVAQARLKQKTRSYEKD